jgi:hypothetical protein
MKHCKRCDTVKPDAEFNKHRNGLSCYCRQCIREYSQEYKRKRTVISQAELERARAKIKENQSEYLYLIVSPTHSGYVKAGRTTKPSKRLGTYNAHTPVKDFEYLRLYKVDGNLKGETHLLDVLRSVAHSRGEWFQIDWGYALQLADQVINQLGGKRVQA